MKTSRKIVLGAFGSAALGTLAWAAGLFPGFPIVGSQSYCLSYVNNGALVCAQTIPAGPTAQTGEELYAGDTGALNGIAPATVSIPGALIGSLNSHRNKIIGGDFATNLWQRGTTPQSSATPSTAAMSADRWYTYSSGNTVTISKQTGTTDSIPSAGLYASMRVNRPSSANVTPICVGQVLDQIAAQNLIGQNAVLSFRALAGAGLSSTANQITATIAYYTASDSATPGTNTGTFATGLITGYQAVVAGTVPGTVATSVTAGAALIPITTSWATYEVYGPIPSVNASGTAVVGAGISICYTPTGSGGATDWFELEAVQLSAVPSIATSQMPNGVTGSPGFERRPAMEEALYQYYYSYVLTDSNANQRFAVGQATTTATSAHVLVLFPVPLRRTPSVTVSTATSFAVTTSTGTAQACTTLAGTASGATPNASDMTCTTASGLTAGNATFLEGSAAQTGATVVYSAEP